jgi:DNA-binding NarL/FixJ family response regulator
MPRVVLVDDHQVMRDALRVFLERRGDWQVVAEAADADGAYEATTRTDPDLVVLDLAFTHGAGGVTILRELLRRQPARRVLVLSALQDPEHVLQAVSAGARGYALKLDPAEELLTAMTRVAHGERYLAPAIARYVESWRPRRRSYADGPLAALSAREKEVFDLLVAGHSNESIAANFCISVKTVETHRTRIFRKLRAHSLADLVRFAARHELLQP